MPANNERTFSNSFWGENDRGLEVLMNRMRGAKHICEEVQNLVRERAAIEEDYGKRLLKLSKAMNPKEELGTLRDSLDVVKTELEVSAKSHLDLANEIRNQLDKPLQDFMATQSGIRKNHQANVEKQLKLKGQLTAAVVKSKERYESKCMETNQLLQMRQATLPPKEADKIKQKLEKTQAMANQSDFDYLNGVEKLADTHKKWEEDFRICCSDSQKLEEDRIDFLRSHLWNYANLISTVCVADDESCERIRLSLEKCDIEKDIQLFLDQNATGSEIPPPLQYINFYTGAKEKTPAEQVPHPSAAPNMKPSSSMNSSRSSIANNPFGAPPQSRGSVADHGFATAQDPNLNMGHIAENMYGPILGGPGFGPSGGLGVDRDQGLENRRTSTVAKSGNAGKEPAAEEGFFHYDPHDVDEKAGVLFSVKVLYDYQSQAFEELDITKGQIVPVIATHDDGWWEGIIFENGRKRKGLFPSNFVETVHS